MVAFQLNKSKAKLFAGGVVKPSQITTGIIEAETIASGAMLPISTGGGVISGGDTPVTPKYTFTINPTPIDAVVTINGQAVNSITAEENTAISWEVSAEGYTSQSGTETLTADKTIYVVLEQQTAAFVQSADYVADGITNLIGSSNLEFTLEDGFAKAYANGFNDKVLSYLAGMYVYTSSSSTYKYVQFDLPTDTYVSSIELVVGANFENTTNRCLATGFPVIGESSTTLGSVYAKKTGLQFETIPVDMVLKRIRLSIYSQGNQNYTWVSGLKITGK